jgi:regulator of CtrA degradation
MTVADGEVSARNLAGRDTDARSMSLFGSMTSDETLFTPSGRSRAAVVDDFARSELFDRTFQEGMELVEETAAYLDGDGRRESRLLSRAAALAYAGESMKLTTRLMQIASWLLVQRAVREGDMTAETACETRYRLANRIIEAEPTHAELPIALIEYLVRAEKLYDRALHLDRRMYLDAPDEEAVNPVQSQMDRLTAAFRQ